jgi:hypothetical protein
VILHPRRLKIQAANVQINQLFSDKQRINGFQCHRDPKSTAFRAKPNKSPMAQIA